MDVMGARTTVPRHALMLATVSGSCSFGGKWVANEKSWLNAKPAAAPKNKVGEKMPPAPPQA
jgi:hypothetical protein